MNINPAQLAFDFMAAMIKHRNPVPREVLEIITEAAIKIAVEIEKHDTERAS